MNCIYIAGILILVSFSACQPVKLVTTETSNRLEVVNRPETFAFREVTQEVKVNRSGGEQTEQMIQQAIAAELEDRGFTYSEEAPDFLMDLDLILRSEKGVRNSSPYPFRGPIGMYPYGRRGAFWGNDEITRTSYMEARITLTTAEPVEQVMIWKGVATAKLTGNAKKRVKRLEEAVDKLMASFETSLE